MLCTCITLDGAPGAANSFAAMAACLDALLIPNGPKAPPCETLLVHCALPLADVLPEATPVEMKAALLMAQQMLEGACKMVLAAGLAIGRLDEHDLNPVRACACACAPKPARGVCSHALVPRCHSRLIMAHAS